MRPIIFPSFCHIHISLRWLVAKWIYRALACCVYRNMSWVRYLLEIWLSLTASRVAAELANEFVFAPALPIGGAEWAKLKNSAKNPIAHQNAIVSLGQRGAIGRPAQFIQTAIPLAIYSFGIDQASPDVFSNKICDKMIGIKYDISLLLHQHWPSMIFAALNSSSVWYSKRVPFWSWQTSNAS